MCVPLPIYFSIGSCSRIEEAICNKETYYSVCIVDIIARPLRLHRHVRYTIQWRILYAFLPKRGILFYPCAVVRPSGRYLTSAQNRNAHTLFLHEITEKKSWAQTDDVYRVSSIGAHVSHIGQSSACSGVQFFASFCNKIVAINYGVSLTQCACVCVCVCVCGKDMN